LFTDREVHLDRIDLRNRSEVGSGSHQIAHLDFVNASDAIHQRSDFGPAEIEVCPFHRGLARCDCSLSRELRLHFGIQLRLWDRLLGGQWSIAIYVKSAL